MMQPTAEDFMLQSFIGRLAKRITSLYVSVDLIQGQSDSKFGVCFWDHESSDMVARSLVSFTPHMMRVRIYHPLAHIERTGSESETFEECVDNLDQLFDDVIAYLKKPENIKHPDEQRRGKKQK